MLARYGLHTKKRLGQHYLVDPHVLDKILAAADVDTRDCVLEIGPGLGAVTQALAERAGRVCAVELDMRSVEALRDLFKENENVQISQGDILKLDLRSLLSEYGGSRLKVVANLPYYITTPVIMYLLEGPVRFESITVMVQREVAERMNARPSSKDYGALTLAVRYHAQISVAAHVPPNCFMPRPKVDSAVVHLIPRSEPPVSADKDAMFRVIRAAFNQRRKTLANALFNGAGDTYNKEAILSALAKAGLPADIRGEALSLEQFAALTEWLEAEA